METWKQEQVIGALGGAFDVPTSSTWMQCSHVQGLHFSGLCLYNYAPGITGAEVYTCLPLQMAVYFNVFYIPLWAAGSILALHTKVCVHPSLLGYCISRGV